MNRHVYGAVMGCLAFFGWLAWADPSAEHVGAIIGATTCILCALAGAAVGRLLR